MDKEQIEIRRIRRDGFIIAGVTLAVLAGVILTVLFTGCAMNTGSEDPAVAVEGLFGLPDDAHMCQASRQCVWMHVSDLPINGGSDLGNQISKITAAGAVLLKLRGNGDFWCESGWPQGQARCSDGPNKISVKVTNGLNRSAGVEIQSNGLVWKFAAEHDPGFYLFSYNLCAKSQDPMVKFEGNHSSSSNVQVCWGG